jgi:hypothetical protein
LVLAFGFSRADAAPIAQTNACHFAGSIFPSTANRLNANQPRQDFIFLYLVPAVWCFGVFISLLFGATAASFLFLHVLKSGSELCAC